MHAIKPIVAEMNGRIVGYADLQPTGYIDHFFVSGEHPRQGIGSRLMTHLIQEAKDKDIAELTSDVSRAAQPFYERFGFTIVEERCPIVRGVAVPNALMSRRVA
jgi:putative acetyltransferase